MDPYFRNFIAQEDLQDEESGGIHNLNISQKIDSSEYEFLEFKKKIFQENIDENLGMGLDNNSNIAQRYLKQEEDDGQLRKKGTHLVQCVFLDGRRQLM